MPATPMLRLRLGAATTLAVRLPSCTAACTAAVPQLDLVLPAAAELRAAAVRAWLCVSCELHTGS